MTIDFNKPVITDNYEDVVDDLREMLAAIAKMQLSSANNIPTNALQWNDTDKLFEKYNGSTWETLFDYVNIQNQIKDYFSFATSAGTANAQTLTLPEAPSAYALGQRFRFKVGTVNTGSATLNVNSLGAKTIKTLNGQALIGGELNNIVEVVYDGTDMILVIFEPAWTTWTPANPTSNAGSLSAMTNGYSLFKNYGDKLDFKARFLSGTLTTTNASYLTLVLPKATRSLGHSQVCSAYCSQSSPSRLDQAPAFAADNSTNLDIFADSDLTTGGWAIGSGLAFMVSGTIVC